MESHDYREIAALAQQRRDASIPSQFLLPSDRLSSLPLDVTGIPRESGHFTRDEVQIIESEAEEILFKISEKTWTAVEVTQAFCKAAVVAQQLTNCLTEIFFKEAVAHAQQLDDHLATTGQLVGPLHGLPISLKDCLITPPYSSAIGMASYANKPTRPEEESVIVTLLRSLGAVFFVKTNVPVAMMMMETDNNVYGPTINPHHRGLSAGGSSGGESALIAMRASPLGIGTDIGGSVRIPAAFCGLYGLRPSFGRYPTYGTRSGIPGQEFIYSVNGPMSRSLETLSLYSAALLSTNPWTHDPKCVPLPWRPGPHIQPPGRKLRLAFTGPTDGICAVHPPVERALRMTRQAVEAAGHEVVDWDFGAEHMEAVKMLLAAFLDFGGSAIMAQLEPYNEPIFPSMSAYALAAQMASQVGTGLTPDRLRATTLARNALARRHLLRWASTASASGAPIDGLITPVSPWAACRAGVTNTGPDGMSYVGYTGWVNLLDLPACTFPVTRADARVDVGRAGEGWVAGSELEGRVQGDYGDGAFYAGAPVGLQVVGERLGEEKVLEVVGVVRDALVAMDGVRR